LKESLALWAYKFPLHLYNPACALSDIEIAVADSRVSIESMNHHTLSSIDLCEIIAIVRGAEYAAIGQAGPPNQLIISLQLVH
jgi:hypothetical protein